FAKDNRTLGQFNLGGIPPAPRGVPQIEVEFNIDANGILTVTATEKKTGKKADITISNSGGLSKDEIEKMKRDAEAHAAEDKKRREVVDLKNRADGFIVQTRRALEEHGSKVSGDVRGRIESAISSLETAVKSDDKDAIERALKAAETASMELGKAMYDAAPTSNAAAAAQAEAKPDGSASGSTAGRDDVIDADFEVKDGKR
ncbi:MAG: Hsp70 family protein, partial [Phycisphaerales bacterium]|nr:Hsp70 family protein [Phycisphaerales bacterium]